MPAPRALFALALAAALLFAAGVALDVFALRLATKAWPVVLLTLWVWRRAPAGAYRRFIVLGLAASLAGDMLLEIDRARLFVPGLLAFLVAHLFYIAAYSSDTRALAPLRAIPGYAYAALVIALLWPGLGRLAIPVTVYTFVICTMIWRAAARVGAASERSARLALGGALIFAASDSMIAFGRFGEHLLDESLRTGVPWRLGIMATYWIGQWAIAASAAPAPGVTIAPAT